MAKNEETGRSHNPKDGGDGGGEETQGDCHDHQASVQVGRSQGGEAEVQIRATEEGDSVQTKEDKGNDEEKQPVGEKGVQRQQAKDDGVVSAEVSKVEVDSGLGLSPGGGLGDSSVVEEVSWRLEVGESVLERGSLGLC